KREVYVSKFIRLVSMDGAQCAKYTPRKIVTSIHISLRIYFGPLDFKSYTNSSSNNESNCMAIKMFALKYVTVESTYSLFTSLMFVSESIVRRY
ncbi:hypothetical protein, partial [Bacillus cereus]|uniref:hypothetical protein n=1 Tax=Bacillus cereus TaxID=1396 RepID=UPI001AD92BAA